MKLDRSAAQARPACASAAKFRGGDARPGIVPSP